MTKDEAAALNEKAVAVAKLIGAAADVIEASQHYSPQTCKERVAIADKIFQKLLTVAAKYADMYEADSAMYDVEG